MADYAAKSEILKANFLENMRSFAIMFILSNKRNWYLRTTRRERFLKLQFVAKYQKKRTGDPSDSSGLAMHENVFG